MKTRVVLLFPFDLGLELDLSGQGSAGSMIEGSSQDLPDLTIGGKIISGARAESHLYRFGTGLIQILFDLDFDLNESAEISCNAEKIAVGKTAVLDWCQSRVDELIESAEPFAAHRYDLRLRAAEIFPVFIFAPANVKNADRFIRDHYKALYGIVAGEPNFDSLSDFVFQRDPLSNFGYYENELVSVKRFGAVVSSPESNTILDLIALAYAQYWSLRSYDFVLDSEIDTAQKLLEDLPPYYQFWKIFRTYQKFSKESIDFARDKLSIVDSLHNVSANPPTAGSDWHLRTVYKNVEKVFDLEELYKTVEVKLVRTEEAYNTAREFISTTFFILLDIIFALWLVWGVIDTGILLLIARK
jgi:hypothetical protein